jgi:hypothetical protein
MVSSQFNDHSMKLLFAFTFLLVTVQGCVNRNKEPKHFAGENSVTIDKGYYNVSIDGQSGIAHSKEQLLDLLGNYRSDDTLLVVIKDAHSRQIDTVLKSLRLLGIKRKVEVTMDFFKLPE